MRVKRYERWQKVVPDILHLMPFLNLKRESTHHFFLEMPGTVLTMKLIRPLIDAASTKVSCRDFVCTRDWLFLTRH